MIKWCAYCQKYQGEQPPFSDNTVSHGMCQDCGVRGLEWSPEEEDRIGRLADLNRRIWAAGRSGDQEELTAVVQEALRSRVRPIDLLFGIAGPALVRVGELWASNELTVADEHQFTRVCEKLVRLIAGHIGRREAVPSSGSVLLANVQGNEHFLGIEFVKLGLESIGLRAELSLLDIPAERLVDLAAEGRHPAVGISISMHSQVESLVRTLRAFQDRSSFTGRIFVGGAIVNNGFELSGAFPSVRFLSRPVFSEAEGLQFR
jgi:methanogenic corrinoid protein MtbC1